MHRIIQETTLNVRTDPQPLTNGERTCASADSTAAPNEATTMTQQSHGSSPICSLLPFPARSILARAAQTPVTEEDPFSRERAIREATDRVRREYPQFFKAPGSSE